MAVLLKPEVLAARAFTPLAVLEVPEVLLAPAPGPTKRL